MKNLLKKLIQAKATADNGELGAANVLAEYFSPVQIECEIDRWEGCRANFAAHIKSKGQRPGLLFAAHLDVVPPGDAAWRFAPFDAVEDSGKIHGRGAADMKGATAALAAAILEVAANVELKGDLIFAATAGEETDSCGTKRFFNKHSGNLPPLAGIVIPEPTDFDVVTAHRGMLWLKITTKGKTAHGSMPHLGINAIAKTNMLLTRLSDYEISGDDHPLLGKCSMSINQIHGGKAVNVIPDECSIKIDIRTVPGRSHQQIIDDFHRIFAELKTRDPDFDAGVDIIRGVAPLLTDTESAFVKSFCEIAGVDKTTAVGFTTDGPFFAALDVPTVIFGPGKPDLCHKPDEYIDIGDLEKAKEYYKDIILNFLT